MREAQDDENPSEAFERAAKAFYDETGMLAPGKSQSRALGGTPSRGERMRRWEEWLKQPSPPTRRRKDER